MISGSSSDEAASRFRDAEADRDGDVARALPRESRSRIAFLLKTLGEFQ
jgi:hypothetical protein